MPATKYRLFERVLEKSVSDDFNVARFEWRVTDMWKDESPNGATCVCGKRGCFLLAEITHKETGIVLTPIGSKCVDFFRPDFQKWMRRGHKNLVISGKHHGKTFIDIWKLDRAYCEFVVEHDHLSNSRLKAFKRWYVEGKAFKYIEN